MIETLKRRLADQIGESPMFVAEGSRVVGNLETRGPLVVSGSILGDGHVEGPLHLAATASWEGEIHARMAVIAGKVTGRLVVADRLEVGAGAVIQADVIARTIAVARGAVIDGTLTVTSGQPVVEFEEKRTPR